MEEVITFLIFVFIFFALVTLIGHGIWVVLAFIFNALLGKAKEPEFESLNLERCPNCNALLHPLAQVCSACGWQRSSLMSTELFKDIGAAQRILQRLRSQGSISQDTHQELLRVLQTERERLASSASHTTQTFPPPQTTPRPQPETPPGVETPQPSTPVPPAPAPTIPIPPAPIPPSVVFDESHVKTPVASGSIPYAPPRWGEDERPRQPPPEPFERKPRKPLTEVLAAFMEQSNIRWGEIIGGLLIIGCSTALVISLWNEISSIPVLKFLIFTTVTAALFGVGLYTEHRWKLPTTSRGILTIATLLVPLNFLAIAAVSKGTMPTGAAIIASELIAPALFLCLVYFAGRIITPAWPHLLVASVLGSSIGQLLIRHLAYAGISPTRLLVLGFFPLICFVIATGWMLRRASKMEEIDESIAGTIFVTLGAGTFASLLPLGLLSYKTGQTAQTLMQVAPLVTLGGGPILASGLLIWRKVKSRELAATRTAGTSIALIGALLSVAGIILSFPNPASVVIACLCAFVIFTSVAIFFDEPRAHLFAALSFALASLVAMLATTGQVAWQSPRHTSLVSDLFSLRGGQAMAVLFVLFLAVSESWKKRGQVASAKSYLYAAQATWVVCLSLAILFGLGREGDPQFAAPIFVILSAGAFFIAWREKMVAASWLGSGVLLFTLGHIFKVMLGVRFPWQAAMLAHASLAGVAAIVLWRKGAEELRRIIATPLNLSALIVSIGVVFTMFEAYRWEPTALYAQRLLWLSCVWLVLLWLNRSQLLFTAMQVALTCAVTLAVKLGLQNYEWHAFVRDAWLHPWSLQVQGSVLVMLGLLWTGLRIFVRQAAARQAEKKVAVDDEINAVTNVAVAEESWLTVAWSYLNTGTLAFDRMLTAAMLCGFVLMAMYGALHGIKLELTIRGGATSVWNIARFPHEYAYGAGAWILMVLLLLSMLAGWWERRRFAYALGALLALSTIVPLLAARWETVYATASAWRWLAASFLLLMSLPLWWRETVFAQLKTFGLQDTPPETNDSAHHARLLLLALTIVPILSLTIYPVLKAVEYLPVHGPSAGLFYQLGAVVSYSIPLALVCAALIGHAVREREAGFAFAGGLMLNLAVTTAQVLAVSAVNGSMNRVVLVQILQLNATAAGCFALIWLSLRGWWMRDDATVQMVRAKALLKAQAGIGLVLNLLLIAPLVWWLFAQPEGAGLAIYEAGSIRGWLSLVLPLLAAIWLVRAYRLRFGGWLLFIAVSGAGALVTFDVTRWRGGAWAGYHALMLASVATAWLMLFAGKLPAYLKSRRTAGLIDASDAESADVLSAGWIWESALFASVTGAWTVLLALRAAPFDENRPWWSVGALVATGGLAAGLSRETLSRAYLYAAGALFNLAAVIWFFTMLPDGDDFLKSLIEFIDVNVIALALPGMAWVWLELRARRMDQERKSPIPPFHHLAALSVIGGLGLVVLLCLMVRLSSSDSRLVQTRGWLQWLASLSAVGLMAACLWDRRARYAVAGLHLLGLFVTVRILSRLGLRPHHLAWLLMLFMMAYALLTSLIWKSRAGLMAYADRLKIPSRAETPLPGLSWLASFNFLLAVIAVLIFWTVMEFVNIPLKVAGAAAIGAQVLTFGMLAKGVGRSRWQRIALLMLAVGTVYFSWAWLAHGASDTWLNRAVLLMIVMFGAVAVYGLVMNRQRLLDSDWSRAAQKLIPWMAGTGALALAFVLVTEVVQQMDDSSVRINLPALITVGAVLLSASVMCIFFAVSPAHDPLKLSERGRMNYVYVAELLLALLFMHIRLTMPWLFTGFFAQYWPLVIVALAYAGVGASEILRRQGLMVLAHPVERTGALLPMLPVLGYWMVDSRVDYSLLLFAIGMLYGGLSILRNSLVFGILAALAGNGALWYLLHHTGEYKFTQHPQLWLIPLSLSVLVASYLNREQFSKEQMMSIRYLTLMTIYVSSTSDIFINGAAESPWLPLALAGLSLAGIFSGIMFRVRAFLFLGLLFLLIAIITMIWYAHVNLGWTWLWYVAGIATGTLIIFTFALFEKKRSEMLEVLESLRGWEK